MPSMVLSPKIELCCKLPTDLTTITGNLTGSLSGFDQHIKSVLYGSGLNTSLVFCTVLGTDLLRKCVEHFLTT